MGNDTAKKKILYVIGTRPEIIRSSLIISALKDSSDVEFKLVHTGQHYDYLINDIFFEELDVPEPDINLGVGSSSHAKQTAGIMERIEEYYLDFNPDLVAVFGDTNSSLAAALAAVKLKIPVAHLEAGCREWDMDVPEEVNRRLIDHCSTLLLAVSETGVKNLEEEKVLGEIYNTGDPLYEMFEKYYEESCELTLKDKLGISDGEYFFITIHRPNIVDDAEKLQAVLSSITNFTDHLIVFPVHPRTMKQLERISFPASETSNLKLLDPISYIEVIHLVKDAKLVVTDSGGLQKEAFWCKTPCVTLRDISCWPETVEYGLNLLAGDDGIKTRDTIEYIIDNYHEITGIFSDVPNPYWKEEITSNIVSLLTKYAGSG